MACAGGSATPPDAGDASRTMRGASAVPAAAPGIRGTVTAVIEGDSVAPAPGVASPATPVSCPPSCGGSGRPLRSVRIEATPGADAGGDKSVVTMLASARVLRRTATGVEPVGFSDLRVGQRVVAWFDGPVAESYPTQARGLVVLIEP